MTRPELQEKVLRLFLQYSCRPAVQNEQEKASKNAQSYNVNIQKLNTDRPGKEEAAKKARAAAKEKEDRLKGLKTEVQAEEKRAADLERQAQEARCACAIF